jgi:ABC-2 type transport system ATP-binding protein
MKKPETGPPGPVVACRSVSLTYRSLLGRRRVRALSSIDLEVERGEIVGLLGPNGSGKTTLFKILIGAALPDSGRVLLFGESPRSRSVKSRLGFMPEENDLHGFLSVKGILRLHGRLAGLTRAEIRRRSDRLTADLGLEGATGPVRHLSRGTVRKLALAQALIGGPELLLLDEPTSGIDPILSEQVKGEIRRRREAGTAVLLSSHLLSDVEEMCDRIVVLHEGRTICAGPTSEMLARPGESEIRFRGVPESTRRKLRETIEADGGEVVSSSPPSRSLREFFLELTGGSRADAPVGSRAREPRSRDAGEDRADP